MPVSLSEITENSQARRKKKNNNIIGDELLLNFGAKVQR